MKWYQRLTAIALFSMHAAAPAATLSDDVKVDLLVEKITYLLKAERHAEALPYFEELEATGTPMPERFYYYYIDALDKSGNRKKTVARTEEYIKRFGKKGGNYGNVIAIMSRNSIQLEQTEKEKGTRRALKAEFARRFATVEAGLERTHTINYPRPASFFEYVPSYKALILEYNEKIQEPALARLKELMTRRDMLGSKGVPDDLNEEIRETMEDIGFVSSRSNLRLSHFYTVMEETRAKSDARTIEAIRLKSWVYSHADERKWTWYEATTRVKNGMSKFEGVLSDW